MHTDKDYGAYEFRKRFIQNEDDYKNNDGCMQLMIAIGVAILGFTTIAVHIYITNYLYQ